MADRSNVEVFTPADSNPVIRLGTPRHGRPLPTTGKKYHFGLVDWFSERFPKFRWIENAILDEGHNVTKIRTDFLLNRKQADLDIVLFSQSPPINYSELPNHKTPDTPWACWVFDYLGDDLPLLDRIPWTAFDIVFSKCPDKVKGTNSVYLDQGCPPWPDIPIAASRGTEILFPGRWSTRREDLVTKWASRNYDIAIAGRGWKLADENTAIVGGVKCRFIGERMTNDEMFAMFSNATITLGDDYDTATIGYWSDRRWLAVAAGSIYCGPSIPRHPSDVRTGANTRMLIDGSLDPESPAKCRDSEWVLSHRKHCRQLKSENSYHRRVQQMVSVLEKYEILN